MALRALIAPEVFARLKLALTERGETAGPVSFPIFHITFVICHWAREAAPAMTNGKRKMENGK
jgi:hypothetical protein